MRYAIKNPLNVSPEQVNKFSDNLYNELVVKAKTSDLEIHEVNFQHLIYEYHRLEFSIPEYEVERVFWENTAPGAHMPNVRPMLAFLRENGIRTGVISNASWSGHAMTERITRFLPEHPFEFIIVSSEYLVRKPNPRLFELALRKADLPAEDVWCCGDSIIWDVEGAAGVGIFPVWYDDRTFDNAYRVPGEVEPPYEHLHIHDWLELVEVLKNCAEN